MLAKIFIGEENRLAKIAHGGVLIHDVGVTAQVGDDNTKPTDKDRDEILKRAKKLLPALKVENTSYYQIL